MSGVQVEQRGAVLEVTLDRPPANAIDNATSREMGEIFAAFRDDPTQRVAILTGAGNRFFSAGWDLKAAAGGEGLDGDYGVGGFGGLQELPGLNKPVIAAVNGMAVGGGFELVLAADLVVVADHARFRLPEALVSILPDAASIKLRRRIPYHVAVDLLMTGRWMEAAEARQWGLLRDVVPAGGLLSTARELADLLVSAPPLVLPAIKETLRETEEMTVADAFAAVSSGRLPAVATLYASEDANEGARAFAEGRQPVWKGR